ncbi:MAG: alanine-tRNA synthetase second additional domain-containing protein [Spirochaetaceae bacterium]|jgi:tRNA A37 threonylcarbamoyladenosine biosynthesis protein TsaE|nr:alanine-tRNA synthetase second additional domain-containing protein [Spirochaetaceae bacterium]
MRYHSDRMQKSHLYTVFFAPRGFERMAELGSQIAQQYLSPFDKLIGLVGLAGSGKSMMIKGMFPGLELTNDDDGVNTRPLPLMEVNENVTGFYTAHTYHVDIHFEAAFTQMHELATAVKDAVSLGKRVIVEHFDLIYPILGTNADLLIGIGEEVIITRPTLFGPEPADIADIVFKSQDIRRQTHTVEDLCEYVMRKHGMTATCLHADVRHGFILSFTEKPDLPISLEQLEQEVKALIAASVPISFQDDMHIRIGEESWVCHGPRMHVRNTEEIKHFSLNQEFIADPSSGRYLLVGVVGEQGTYQIRDINKI